MEMVKKAFLIIGRFILGAMFVLLGIQKILDWNAALLRLENALCDWGKASLSIDFMQELIHRLLNWSTPFLVVIVVLEVLGGLFLALGYKAKTGASFLILVGILTTILFHSFWIMPREEMDTQVVLFLYRLGVIGGLFIAWAQAGGFAKSTSPGAKK